MISPLCLTKNPEANFRYLPVIKDLSQRSGGSDLILEVGGGDFNLTNFCKRPITVLDTSFNPKVESSLVTAVISVGQKFPFPDASFDFVVSLDTLEHISKADRPLFLKELQRVSKKYVYIGFPEGSGAVRQDQELNSISSEKFLREHIKNGLPNLSQVTSQFANSGWRLVWQKSNVNLRFRGYLMRLWLLSSRNLLFKVVFKMLGLFSPLYKLFSIGECYRQILFFEKSF